MITLFDCQWIISRLKTEVSGLKLVAGAADLASASADLKQTPSVFVIPVGDRASGNRTGTMIVSQNNVTRFAVILAVQNLRDPRGEKAQDVLLPIRTPVMEALHGWQPDAEFDPIEYAQGRLLRMTNQVLWWQDEYLTSNEIRSI